MIYLKRLKPEVTSCRRSAYVPEQNLLTQQDTCGKNSTCTASSGEPIHMEMIQSKLP